MIMIQSLGLNSLVIIVLPSQAGRENEMKQSIIIIYNDLLALCLNHKSENKVSHDDGITFWTKIFIAKKIELKWVWTT